MTFGGCEGTGGKYEESEGEWGECDKSILIKYAF